jgi:hypothetical protein
MTEEYGPWQSLSVLRLRDMFNGAPFRWWLSGGLALEQFAGVSWREHDDIDIGICRLDAPQVHRWLVEKNQHLWIAAGGDLAPWSGRALNEEACEDNVWMKSSPDGPWVLDIQVGDGDDASWTYRREKSVQREWSTVVLMADQLPYLSPEIQLLFKSKGLRPKDYVDARRVIALFDGEQRAWLRAHLPSDHEWIKLLVNE